MEPETGANVLLGDQSQNTQMSAGHFFILFAPHRSTVFATAEGTIMGP